MCYFVSTEYYANSSADMTWLLLQDAVGAERVAGPLTVKEQMIIQEKVSILYRHLVHI